MGVQEVRWDKEGTVRAGDYNFFLGIKKRKPSVWNRVFCTQQNNTSSSESSLLAIGCHIQF